MQSTTPIRFLLYNCGKHYLNPNLIIVRHSSKTPVKSNLGVATTPSSEPRGAIPWPQQFPPSQSVDLVSPKPLPDSQVILPQPQETQIIRKQKRKKREILRMDEEDYKGRAILQRRPPLKDRRGEFNSFYEKAWGDTTKKKNADILAIMHGDWDVSIKGVRKWYKSLEVEAEIREQLYKPERNKVLGNDLALAHFVVFRKGRIRFKGQTEWVETYRRDAANANMSDDDLPVMRFDLCTLPVKFDPRYRVEAVDCAGLPLRYEGLQNFENLNYVKWLSFRETPYIDDWCLDKITRIFYETLEYVDLSGCLRLSERGVGALAKCKNLKTLVVEDMRHCKHLEMVCAMLEDQIPDLTVIGIDYSKKLKQIQREGEEIEQRIAQARDKLEANTLTIEPISVPLDETSRNTSNR